MIKYKRCHLFLLLFLVAVSSKAQQKGQRNSARPSNNVSEVSKLIDRSYDDLVRLYQHLHQHPELSFQEKETSTLMARELRKLGFEVIENVGGFGVVGVLSNGKGPVVMVRTDMDALPIKEETGLPFASAVMADDGSGRTVPVMHACGHDFHMASWVGTARVLTQLKNIWKGTLVFIAQPAEEQSAGAKSMIEDGLYTRFPRPDWVLGLHVNASLEAGKVGYTSGHALANVDGVTIKVNGRGGHGAAPHNTIDPVILASRLVIALQTMVAREFDAIETPAVISVGSIHGGTTGNVIPNEVKLELTVRSFGDETRTLLIESIKRTCNGLAMSAGLSEEDYPMVTVREAYTPSVYNDPELTRQMVQVFSEAFGSQNVITLNKLMVGEDFSHYRRVEPAIPTLLYSVGTVAPGAMDDPNQPLSYTHSSKYQPEIDPALRVGIMSMSMSVLQLLKK